LGVQFQEFAGRSVEIGSGEAAMADKGNLVPEDSLGTGRQGGIGHASPGRNVHRLGGATGLDRPTTQHTGHATPLLREAGTRTEIVQIDHRILSRVITDCKSKSVKSIILGILAANRSFARVYKPAY
jgi:hypothetical protein